MSIAALIGNHRLFSVLRPKPLKYRAVSWGKLHLPMQLPPAIFHISHSALFAEQNHDLVIDYLHRKRLPMDDYYDVVIFGYLSAVQQYFRDNGVRCTAIFNPFVNRYFVDDVYGVQKEGRT